MGGGVVRLSGDEVKKKSCKESVGGKKSRAGQGRGSVRLLPSVEGPRAS